MKDAIKTLASNFADSIINVILSTPLEDLLTLKGQKGLTPHGVAAEKKRSRKTKKAKAAPKKSSAKRGRPKGSKNKPKDAPAAVEPTTEAPPAVALP